MNSMYLSELPQQMYQQERKAVVVCSPAILPNLYGLKV